MPTYHCVTHTHKHRQNLAAAASSKEAPHPHFPSDSSPVDRRVLCRGERRREVCLCVCVCMCVCVCVSHGDPMSARILEWVGEQS